MHSYESFAQDGSKGRRREHRRDIRTVLGTSGDPAPTVYAALRAADSLKGLLDLASSGRFGLAVVDFAASEATGQTVTVPVAVALADIENIRTAQGG